MRPETKEKIEELIDAIEDDPVAFGILAIVSPIWLPFWLLGWAFAKLLTLSLMIFKK